MFNLDDAKRRFNNDIDDIMFDVQDILESIIELQRQVDWANNFQNIKKAQDYYEDMFKHLRKLRCKDD